MLIAPLVGIAPLAFGQTEAQVAELIGPSNNVYRSPTGDFVSEARSGHRFPACTFGSAGLDGISVSHRRIDALHLGTLEILATPLIELLAELDRLNGGTGQAQGGSLYYVSLGLALLQFEHRGDRWIEVMSEQRVGLEPLRDVTVTEVLEYYAEHSGEDPAQDRFGWHQD